MGMASASAGQVPGSWRAASSSRGCKLVLVEFVHTMACNRLGTPHPELTLQGRLTDSLTSRARVTAHMQKRTPAGGTSELNAVSTAATGVMTIGTACNI